MAIEKDTIFKKMQKSWLFWLLLITSLAIIIRSIPGWIYAAWGCDFGIYLGLTKSLIASGELYNPYTGWGSSYEYFPVLFAVNGFASWITGLDVLVVMTKLTPIFGGLSVLIFYFIAKEVIEDKKIALLSSLFFAVLPFHVYQTSHASPLTMGHFFMMLSIFIFLKYRKNSIYLPFLLISTVLLIMSHHLTTYFYLIVLISIVFCENAASKTWTITIKSDVFYILLTSVLIFTYWALIATTVFDGFMRSGFKIGDYSVESIHIIIIFYIVYAFSFLLIKYIRKLNIYLLNNSKEEILKNIGNKKYLIKILLRINPFILKKWPNAKSRIKYFFIVLLIIFGSVLYYSFIKMPWTEFAFTQESLIYITPFLIALAFAIVGFRYSLYLKQGQFIRGWIFAIGISFIYSIITKSGVFLADRHPEYVMAPMAILIVFGLGGIFSDPYNQTLFSELNSKKKLFTSYMKQDIYMNHKKRLAHFFIVMVLVILLGSTVYVAHSSLNIAVEQMSDENINAVEWMEKNLDKNSTMIASDHRLARLAESYGFNTTKDETILLWTGLQPNEYIDELWGVGRNHSKITHVLIDDHMKNVVVHVSEKVFVYMYNNSIPGNITYPAYEKFNTSYFERIYINESKHLDEITNEPIHWTEIYKVNWTYIDEYILKNN